MRILALEFSSPQRSVAVVDLAGGALSPPTDNEALTEQRPPTLVAEVIETAAGHTMKPLRMVEAALQQAGLEREQIECLAVGLGPGSYTGIRAAIALGQGWELAGSVRLIGVSSVEAVVAEAEALRIHGRVNVVIDAQRNEFYLAVYEISAAGRREIELLRLASFAEVQGRAQSGEQLIGPEVNKWFSGGRVVFPRAAAVARVAASRTDFMPGEKLEPIYLRETKFVKARRNIPQVNAPSPGVS